MTKTKAQFQAQGRTNRSKGKAGQREFLRLFIAWLTGLPHDHPDQAIRYSSTQHHPDGFLDGSPVDSWHIETKKCRWWEPKGWIREAERDAGPNRPWFIAARLPGVWWCHVPKEKREAVRWFVILPTAMLVKFLVGLPRWYELTVSGSGKAWHIRDAIRRQDIDMDQCVRIPDGGGDPISLWSVELPRPKAHRLDDPEGTLKWSSYSLIPARTWAYLVGRVKDDARVTSGRASMGPESDQGPSE